jgi:beta-phosphoglucomutase-like phosphatase (HAD superfamily)
LLVIFDCDGVVVDSELLVNRIESEYFSRLGVEMTPEETGRLFKGKTVAEVADTIVSMSVAPLPQDWMYGWGTAVALGFAKELKAVAGITETLEMLVAAGRPFCVASQSPLPRIAMSLYVTKLDRYFDDRLFSVSMVPRPKPAPDIFLLAARRMGADPANCIVVEDSSSGVIAAKAAGMRVLGYAAGDDAVSLEEAGAEVFRRMHDLPELLGLRGG